MKAEAFLPELARKPAGMPTPITIPATSRQHYLGGMAALNLPSPSGTGDWHMEQTFFRLREKRSRSFISGAGCLTDTTPILGEVGIYDCTSILDDLGIPHKSDTAYAANHARATADLVLAAVLRGESPNFVVLDDWMPRDRDKQQVFELLAIAHGHLTAGQQDKVLQWKHQNSIRASGSTRAGIRWPDCLIHHPSRQAVEH
jgi:hypothetical protein